MNDVGWRLIKKLYRGTELVLISKDTKNRPSRLFLSIPINIRKQTGYFKNQKKSHCNLLEKDSLLMIQFIPEKAADLNSHVVSWGYLYFRTSIFPFAKAHPGRYELDYQLDKGNIIIDREQFKHLSEEEKK